MKFDFPRKIRSGYFIAFILLLFAYFLSLSSLIELREQNQWVDHSRQVISKLDMLVADLGESEIGWRNFALTGDDRYFESYVSNRQHTDTVCQELAQLVRDNPVETEKTELLRKLIAHKYDIHNAEMAFARARPFQPDEAFRKHMIENRHLMDSIQVVTQSINAREADLLNQRIRKVGFSQQVVFWIIVTAGICSVLLIIYSLITFNIESRAKKQATKQAEDYHDQLEKRIRELDAANRELIELRGQERFTATGQIARVIAHEVRNPLTNIDLSASHLENPSLNQEDKTTFLEIISRSSKRINQLISELLTATKFSELEYGNIEVNDLVREALHDAGDRLQLNHVRIDKKCTSEHILLKVDRERMKIALLNIIVNAIEAMPAENGILTVETAWVNGKCRISIRDNGKGMDAETRSKIFDPYFTAKSKGNGLGLTNTQNIILNHKGKIEVSSEPGRGSEFAITLEAVRVF
ncbi:MAG TPA: CHASE3 domain-containing protein [Puia sp.]|nr:CHASE3 domain-containing protein [Puia sp.]